MESISIVYLLFGVIIILLLSIFLLIYYFSKRNFESEIIEHLYGLYHTLSSSYDDWRLQHIFATTNEQYMKRCKKINDGFKLECQNLKQNEINVKEIEYSVKEENLIINILLFYEQTFFLYQNADSSSKKNFLRLINKYFKERLLLNPRIVSFVMQSSYGEEVHMEKEPFIVIAQNYKIQYDQGDLRKDDFGPIKNGNFEISIFNQIEKITFENWEKGIIKNITI